MKYLKYIIVISVLFIMYSISNADFINATESIKKIDAVTYNNKTVEDNKVNLDNTELSENNKFNKETITYTNTTSENLKISTSDLIINKTCNKIDINVYFTKDGKNSNEVILKPTESVLINIVFSAEDVKESETCSYNIQMNIGSNI